MRDFYFVVNIGHQVDDCEQLALFFHAGARAAYDAFKDLETFKYKQHYLYSEIS